MRKLLEMTKEIIEAVKALGGDDNLSNRQHLLNTLSFWSNAADDPYTRMGLERVADALRATWGEGT